MGFVGFRQQCGNLSQNRRNSGRVLTKSVITYVCSPTFKESTHECIKWFKAGR
jgi:hypothetical protein